MKAILRAGLALGAALVGLAPAVAPGFARAGGSGGNCHCSPPPPCNCTVPTGHQVNVPGVDITPPSVWVNSPSITVTAPTIDVQTAAVSVSQASADSSATASSQATGSSSANINALAAANSYSAGGGGGFSSSEGGANSYIPNLNVVGVETPEARRICAEFRAVAKVVAVQAVCLDDKAVPHPASQVMPDREVLGTYEGEVFRCIAGARMQYTVADYAGSADFGRGQTVSCQKGEALYHAATGELACRPQRPARDCNERSLLRRYGAGIKVMKLAVEKQCVAWRSETAEASGSAGQSLLVDGGVGGETH